MHRTPPCGDVTLPSAKLGAVTRKKNEIEELLHNHPEDVEPIRKLYTEYLVKVENLLESCNTDELGKWVAPHKEAIDVFRKRIEDWIAIRRVKDVAGKQTSEPSRSVRSHRSAASSTSSARIRLAERKAKITAEKALLEKAKSLECEELALKREYEKNLARLEDLKRRAEVERAEFENEILEAELDKIDKGSSIGSCQSVQALEDVARSAPVEMPRVLEDGFCNEHTPSILQVLSRQNEISSNLVVNQQQNLPKRDLQTFDGSDVTEFHISMRNFEKMIETRCSDPSDRLSYLEQYTSGKARKLVKSCVNYDPETAYRQAKALLNEEFGSEFKVTHAYLDRLNKWPPIKNEDVEALQDLSIYLLRCLNYLESTSPCNPLHSPRELMNIVQKLPYKTREQWRRRTYQKQKAALNVDFGDLVTFIREEVALLKQPMFGQIADPLPPRKDKENKSRILATTLEDKKPSIVCECCGGSSHSLEQCTDFKARSFQEKSDFIKKRGLCLDAFAKATSRSFARSEKLALHVAEDILRLCTTQRLALPLSNL
ncbi:hypothetical protein HAZT_HAZT007008 [Hyalella azteca]|uniref:Uncharacterized protein n=1 Tax=Hyalella azteca TaxID=294128 RepID=A0A6A0H1P9_HYAAZ|nr:hypothetical protein HAZT_HAZT007008 [Hyalella azteca]